MDNNNKKDEATVPAVHTTPAIRSDNPSADRGTSADEHDRKIDMIPHPSTLSAQSLVHFVLGNFFFAMSLISLFICIIFLTVAWLTVLREARSMNDLAPANTTGVSPCFYHSGWT